MTKAWVLLEIPSIYPLKECDLPPDPGAIVFLFTFWFVIKYPCYSPPARRPPVEMKLEIYNSVHASESRPRRVNVWKERQTAERARF